MKQVYVAAPLFSKSELDFNEMIADVLSGYFNVYLPQRDGDLLVELVERGMPESCARKKIFSQDIEAIDKSDYLLIILDGRSVDEGACFELGYAFSKEKLCFGLQTDTRRLLKGGNNPMIDEAIVKTFFSVPELSSWACGSNVLMIA